MTITSFADVISDALQSPFFNLSPDAASTLAVQIVIEAAKCGHAGTDYYLPTFSHLNRDERNARIRLEFNGRNLKDVCRKYGVSRRTVYRAVRWIAPEGAEAEAA